MEDFFCGFPDAVADIVFLVDCCCLPWNKQSLQVENTWVVEEIWTYRKRLRSTHCRGGRFYIFIFEFLRHKRNIYFSRYPKLA